MAVEKNAIGKESASICEYFNKYDRARVLSVSAIEELAKMPKNTLLNLLTANRTIPVSHIIDLVHILENFGYQAQENWVVPAHVPNSIYFYFNYPNRKVTLHKGKCSFCNEGTGAQATILGESNGGWRGRFDTYQSAVNEAQVIAQEMGVTFTNCKRCNPQG